MRLAEAYTNEEDSKGGKERSDSHKVQADLPAISHKGLTDYLDNYVEM